MRFFVFSLFFVVSISKLFAPLVWDAENGWTAKGGLAEEYMGTVINTQSAWETLQCGVEAANNCEDRKALKAFKQVYCKYPNSKLAPEALYKRGELFLRRRQYEDAFKMFQRIIVDYPTYPRFNDVIQVQFEIASKLQKGSRPYYWGIIPGFRDYGASICYFESIVTYAPYSVYAPMALMNIADLACRHKKPEDVVDALERLISNYKHSSLAPMAYLKLAEAHENLVPGVEYDQRATKTAVDYYTDFMHLFPEHECIGEAEAGYKRARNKLAGSKKAMGDFYYCSRNNVCAAKIYYGEAISLAPESDAARGARAQLEKIERGVSPRKTIVDHIFGRYKPLPTPAYLDELELSKKDNERFLRDIDEVNIAEIDECFGPLERADIEEFADDCLEEEAELVDCWERR